MKKSSTVNSKTISSKLKRGEVIQGLIDSNILIYAYDKKSRFHNRAKAWLEYSSSHGKLYLSWQNLLEFYSIITSSKRAQTPLKPQDAISIINNFLDSFEIIHSNFKSEKIFLGLLPIAKPKGVMIYDLYLASTALGNEINTIFTLNTKDFLNIPKITALNPL